MALIPGPTVLVGFAEALAGIESAWSLRDAGFTVVAFSRDGRRPALAASRSVEVIGVPAPEDDADACVAAVAKLIAERQPAATLPLDDHCVWICDQLAPDAVVAGPRGAQARLCLDKSLQLALADKVGLLAPPTTAPGVLDRGTHDRGTHDRGTHDRGTHDRGTHDRGGGPWMVKPAAAIVYADGKLKRPTGRVAATPEDIERIAAGITGPVLVQPVIEGVGEGVFGFAAGGQLYGLSGHRRVRMMNPRGSGSSACRSILVDPDLVEPARAFLAEAGWHGIFMLELLRDAEGRPWFMELNGRPWGSMALARQRGLEYPAWAVWAAMNERWRPEEPAEAPPALARHLGREIVHMLAVLRGGRGADRGRWPGRWSTVRAMLTHEAGTRWYNTRRGELRVFLRDTWQTVAAQVRG